jgi:predicted extracellular nuclease
MNKGNIILFGALALATAILLSSGLVAPTLHEQQSVQAASMRNDLVYSGPRASIALSGNNIYLTWWDNKTGNNEVYFAGSTDSGKTFGEPINLSNAKGASADSQIAAAQNNSVYVTWWDNKTGSWEVFSRASTDNGKTFDDAVMLKSIGGSPVKTLKAPPPTTISVDTIAAASGTNEYIVWWDNTTGNWEVLFAKSTDNGKTFGNPINISNSPDARSVGARMAAQGNNIYISWMDIKPGEKHAMFRASNDNGQTFGNPIMMNITAGNTTTTAAAG